MKHPFMALGLIAFWLLLSGHYDALLLALGGMAISCLAVYTFLKARFHGQLAGA